MTADPTQGATQAETAGLRTIERTAEEHPGVGRAAATIDTDRFGNERLAVHAEPAGAVPPPTSGELRLFLAVRLPEAVQPDAVTVLESLPSDSAGRIDYTALPAASADVPRSVHAALLQDMFAAVVGLPAVDPKDNFFDIGGHSLLATRLVSRVRGVMDVAIGIREVFDSPTIGAVLDEATRPDGPLPAPRHRGPGETAAKPEAQAGAEPPAAVTVTWLDGPVDHTVLRAALEEVAARHDVLRPGEAGVLTVVDNATADEVPGRAAEAQARPLATLLVLGPARHVLVLAAPADRCDRLSAEIVRRDVCTAYAAGLAARRPVWSLPMQADEHSDWLSQVLGAQDDPTSVAAVQLGFWRENLAGLEAQPPLPAEPGPPAGTVSLICTPELEAGLRAVARQQKATLLMVLQAALAALLRRDAQTPDVCLATLVDGRADPAFDDTVGNLADEVLLRIPVADDPAFDELVARVRAVALSADRRKEIPVAQVLAESGLAHPGVFVALTQGSAELPAVPGVVVRPEPVVTHLDHALTVVLHETIGITGEPAGVSGTVSFRPGIDGARVAGDLTALLTEVVADPARPLSVLLPAGGPAKPADETLALVHQAWAGVLKVPAEQISVDEDDFLRLGGSVELITLIGRLQDELGIKLPIEDLLTGDTTVRAMAGVIDRHRARLNP